MKTYPNLVMVNDLAPLNNGVLGSILLTGDGRGPDNKRTALDILLRRAYNLGKVQAGTEGYGNFDTVFPLKTLAEVTSELE